jgi:hypothetical protein
MDRRLSRVSRALPAAGSAFWVGVLAVGAPGVAGPARAAPGGAPAGALTASATGTASGTATAPATGTSAPSPSATGTATATGTAAAPSSPTATIAPATATATATPATTATATATPHASDSFAGASTLVVPASGAKVSTSGSTGSATLEGGEPIPSCVNIGNTVWYRLAPQAAGVLTASTTGSTFDTVLAVYRGGSLTSLDELACNDDAADSTSEVSLGVAAGDTYYLQLGGFRRGDGTGQQSGAFQLQVSLDASRAAARPRPPSRSRSSASPRRWRPRRRRREAPPCRSARPHPRAARPAHQGRAWPG